MDEYGYSWDGEDFWGFEASREDAAAPAKPGDE